VNTDPEGEGWFFKLRLTDPGELGELMNAAQYQDYCSSL
jgi:glycine cleavage system H protein